MGSPCKVFSGDVKVAVNVSEHWFYPDVLSPTAAAYDRGQKFISLQKLSALKEYTLLDTEAELTNIGWRSPVASLLDEFQTS